MTWRSDPVDTVRVYGGSPLSVVDATCVRAAAGRVTVARDQLRQAAWNLGRAAEAIERSAYRQATYGNLLSGGGAGGWGAGSLAPGGLPPRGLVAAPTTGGSPSYLVSGQVSAARRRSLAVQARHTAAQLAVQADGCDLTAIRLIKAAGLYEQAESRVSAVVRGQVNGHVQAVSFAAGAYMGVPMMVAGLLYAKVHPVAAGVYLGLTALPIGVSLLSLWGNGKLLDLLVGGYFSRLTGISFDTPLTMMGGSSDETFTGFATGVAAVLPGLSRCDMSLEGGIFALSQGANVLAPDSGIRVSEFFPDALPSSIPGGHGAMLPSWAGVAEGGISERLSRLDETNPNGGWDAGRPENPHFPEAVITVEKVFHADGMVSHTVLIPGTQGFGYDNNPHDGKTDLDLMGKNKPDIEDAVVGALSAAGVRRGEKVVLIGHSLGGIAAMSLATSSKFTSKFTLGGVVTAGSPTATFTTPQGVPVPTIANDEELVSNTDGHDGAHEPVTKDRVSITRTLSDSTDPRDRQAAQTPVGSHPAYTHVRTLELAQQSGNYQVEQVVGRLESLIVGEQVETRFFTSERIPQLK